MIAGAGSAHLDFTVYIIEAATGDQPAKFSANRTWSWGGIYGMSKGIEEMEQNLSLKIALYLQRCKNHPQDPERCKRRETVPI